MLGNPAESYNFGFDTTSSDSWVKEPFCRLCNPSSVESLHKHQSVASTQQLESNQSHLIEYDDGSLIKGFYIYETISIGNISFNDFKIMSASEFIGYKEIPKYDGILGLSLNTKSNSSIAELAFKANQIPEPILSFYIDDTQTHGELVLGEIDYSKIQGNISWMSLSNDNQKDGFDHWATRIYNVKISTIEYSKEYEINGSVIFDIGTSVSLIGSNLADKLALKLGAITKIPISGAEPHYEIECENIQKLPNITMGLHGFDIVLTGKDYTFKYADDKLPGCYLAYFSDIELESDVLILGNVVLRKLYTVFDYGNRRIGLANKKTSNQTEFGHGNIKENAGISSYNVVEWIVFFIGIWTLGDILYI